jgi:hypothetical protein
MSTSNEQPREVDVATTAQYLGYHKGQAYAIAHLWSFQLKQAAYSDEQARQLFNSILLAYENSGTSDFPLGELQTTIKMHGLSHLEEIFEAANAFLKVAQSE